MVLRYNYLLYRYVVGIPAFIWRAEQLCIFLPPRPLRGRGIFLLKNSQRHGILVDEKGDTGR